MASRYTSFNSRSSSISQCSDPSSSSELKNSFRHPPPFNRLILADSSKHNDIVKVKNGKNLSSMVKKFVETRSGKTTNAKAAAIPVDFISDDLKKTARKGANFTALQKKFFNKRSGAPTALAEVKENTRTVGMVLRSERELLSQNKELETEISQLKSVLEMKNSEIEKLKDLCLKQKREIKELKSAVLFPEEETKGEIIDKQSGTSKSFDQSKQMVPTLEKQVTCLTHQLRRLAHDFEAMKADKSKSNGSVTFPKTLTYDHEDAVNSLVTQEYSTPPDSPYGLLFQETDPFLTPSDSKTMPNAFMEVDRDSMLW